MKASEIAGKLLELFGPDGDRWCTGEYRSLDKRCLGGGLCHFRLSLSALDEYLPTLPYSEHRYRTIEQFNDNSDWPTVKSWLEGIREGKC